ncbi:hypothetical protein [Dactylosporangium sp. CS-033363]|uniref:hypothetical protein n=1 Tax=Dactylosporangium sp. CS-033363 TaxID=3239935 RepID=UPI003D949CAB
MTTNALPTAIRRSQYAVFGVATVHVAAIVLLLTHRDAMHAGQLALHPGGDIDALTKAALLQSLVPHVIFAVLLPLRALRLTRGRRSGRTVLTAVLTLQIAAHATLPMVTRELPGYGGWIIAVQALSFLFEIAALVYLWSPSARTFFRPGQAPAPAKTSEPALPVA